MSGKEVILKGSVPPEINEIGLTRLVRLALAVGVGSAINFNLTEIQSYADPFESETTTLGLPRNLVRKAARLSILLAQVVEVSSALEDEVAEYLDEIGIQYTVEEG